MTSTDELEAEALKLDPKARAHLARRLLASLDELSLAEVEAIWLEEAERRAADDPRDDIPAVDVFANARARLT